MTVEGRSKRTNTACCRPITPGMDFRENHWDRMSLLRLRYHPTMRLPTDSCIPYSHTALAPSFTLTKTGIAIYAPVGLGSLEIQVDEKYIRHLEFPFAGLQSAPPPQHLHLTDREVAELASADPLNTKVCVAAVGTDQRQAEINDYGQLGRNSRLVIQISSDGPAAPAPTFSPGLKLKHRLNMFSHKHDSFQPSVVSQASSAGGYKDLEVIKGIAVGQEQQDNSWIVILNSYRASSPKLTGIEVRTDLLALMSRALRCVCRSLAVER